MTELKYTELSYILTKAIDKNVKKNEMIYLIK